MKVNKKSCFEIKSLNQERLLEDICKQTVLYEIERKSKIETSFACSFFKSKNVEKILKQRGVEYKVVHGGFFYGLKRALTSYGLIAALIMAVLFGGFANQYVLLYEIRGVESLTKQEIVEYIKHNYSNKKVYMDTKQIEIGLVNEFEQISFVSCMIKGQALVVNIKEKLMPNEMFGEFKPLCATKNGTITAINLISGTLVAKVGDTVKKGQILVQPYTVDTSGKIKKVEAKAEIFANVYNESSVDHFDKTINVFRTGKVVEASEISLCGLQIYSRRPKINFEMYEVEYSHIDLIKGNILPLKLKKTYYYEIIEKTIEKSFEEAKSEVIETAKQKALSKCDNCDTINEEFYTIRHLSGVTIVDYIIVTSEQIGGIL